MKNWDAYELQQELDEIWERAKMIAKKLLETDKPKSANSYDQCVIDYDSGSFEVTFEWSHCSCCSPDSEYYVISLDQIVMSDKELEDWFQERIEWTQEQELKKKLKAEQEEKEKKERQVQKEKAELERLKAKYES